MIWTYHTISVHSTLNCYFCFVFHGFKSLLGFLGPKIELSECFQMLKREWQFHQKRLWHKKLEPEDLIPYIVENNQLDAYHFSIETNVLLLSRKERFELALKESFPKSSGQLFTSATALLSHIVGICPKWEWPIFNVCSDTQGLYRPRLFPKLASFQTFQLRWRLSSLRETSYHIKFRVFFKRILCTAFECIRSRNWNFLNGKGGNIHIFVKSRMEGCVRICLHWANVKNVRTWIHVLR